MIIVQASVYKLKWSFQVLHMAGSWDEFGLEFVESNQQLFCYQLSGQPNSPESIFVLILFFDLLGHVHLKLELITNKQQHDIEIN